MMGLALKYSKAMKYLKAVVEKVEEDGTLAVAIASDGSVDRDGERIEPSGWDSSNFIKNPVLLWAHDYRQEPLGKVLSIALDGGRLLFKPQFATELYDKAKRVYEMYKAGILNCFSVGFIPREWKNEQLADGRTVRVYTKAELLEISCVPVPSNPNAIVLAREFGGEEAVTFLKSLCKDAGVELKEPEAPAPAAPTAAEAGTEKPTEAPGGAPAAAEEGATEAKSLKELGERMEAQLAAVKTDVEKQVKDVKDALDALAATIKETTAKNGERGTETKVETVETLIKSGELERVILRTLDKTIGDALRDKRRENAA